jgi:Ca2+/H+ antiporter, TMEM165/GDT1 family
MKKEFRAGKFLMILLFVFAVLVPLGFIIVTLWNNILVPVLHVGAINFWQALGLFLLSKIFFGGFPGRSRWGKGMKSDFREKMRDKWSTMSPEEREKFKQNWKNRCASWRRPSPSDTSAAEQ